MPKNVDKQIDNIIKFIKKENKKNKKNMSGGKKNKNNNKNNNNKNKNNNKNNKKNNKNMRGGKTVGPYRRFRIAILDDKEIHRSETGIGAAQAEITMKANPVDAAKKLFSSICKHKGFKKADRLKCQAIYWIEETTRGHSKMYGPYKGNFVNLTKNGKPVQVKLKTGKVITYFIKPVVKKYAQHKASQKKANLMKGG